MTLDITLDLETCALCPTAAVMSLGAVAWNRAGETTPFFEEGETGKLAAQYYAHVDLRSSFVEGFTFDKGTSEWWAGQSDDAKKAVLEDDEEGTSCLPIKKVVRGFLDWIEEKKSQFNADSVCLWSQGSDFDISILRNICYKYDIPIPIRYTNFRDHRTFFLEGARTIYETQGKDFDAKKAYSLVNPYHKGSGVLHDPIYDCQRSIYSTWQMMSLLRGLHKTSE